MAKEVFLRQSSGLVRDVSPWPSMLANWALITGGTPLLIISWLWLAPGANWALAYLITLIPTLGMAFLYYVAAASMPRAGADYVFNSRAIHPAVGFANYWAEFFLTLIEIFLYLFIINQFCGETTET